MNDDKELHTIRHSLIFVIFGVEPLGLALRCCIFKWSTKPKSRNTIMKIEITIEFR